MLLGPFLVGLPRRHQTWEAVGWSRRKKVKGKPMRAVCTKGLKYSSMRVRVGKMMRADSDSGDSACTSMKAFKGSIEQKILAMLVPRSQPSPQSSTSACQPSQAQDP